MLEDEGMFAISFRYIVNRTGPNIDPWGSQGSIFYSSIELFNSLFIHCKGQVVIVIASLSNDHCRTNASASHIEVTLSCASRFHFMSPNSLISSLQVTPKLAVLSPASHLLVSLPMNWQSVLFPYDVHAIRLRLRAFLIIFYDFLTARLRPHKYPQRWSSGVSVRLPKAAGSNPDRWGCISIEAKCYGGPCAQI